jgi:hypothetical protein
VHGHESFKETDVYLYSSMKPITTQCGPNADISVLKQVEYTVIIGISNVKLLIVRHGSTQLTCWDCGLKFRRAGGGGRREWISVSCVCCVL